MKRKRILDGSAFSFLKGVKRPFVSSMFKNLSHPLCPKGNASFTMLQIILVLCFILQGTTFLNHYKAGCGWRVRAQHFIT
jgi:hypothetical protein